MRSRSSTAWRQGPEGGRDMRGGSFFADALDNLRSRLDESRRRARDYRLTGPEAARAVERGLVDGEWFRPNIDPAHLRRLLEREDARPTRDTLVWLGLVGVTGALAVRARRTRWFLPALAAYGTLYGGTADARWHECGHGTAFRSRWRNDVVYQVASFMLLREPTLWRWSHFRHHSETILVGRDPEITYKRPYLLDIDVPNYLNLVNGARLVRRLGLHALGGRDAEAARFVPEEEWPKVHTEARAFALAIAGATAWTIRSRSLLPVLLLVLPAFYGAWWVVFMGLTQHAGLQEDVLDHRLSTRTVRMNPLFRFLYLNMNYHTEHHLFPGVPYYHLAELHEAVADELPPPSPSVLSAYRDIVAAVIGQRRDPRWELPDRRPNPAGSGSRTAEDARSGDGSAQGSGHAPDADDSGFVDLGPADLIPVGEVVRVEVDGEALCLCRVSEEEYRLVSGTCSHERAELWDGYLDGAVLECPKHNGCFDVRTGEAVRRPATKPIGVVPVSVVGGRVLAGRARVGEGLGRVE